jgi:pimeloyl-ACP methyl ester carboxylesterase
MRRTIRIALFLLIFLILLVLIAPFLIPVPPLQDVVDVRSLADPDSEFIPTPLGNRRLDVHVKRGGAGGLPLVLLHGFAASVFSWRDVMSPLAAARQVVAFDRPAFGLTERPMREDWGSASDWATRNPYSPQAQVELTVNLLDELGIEQAVLVGHSAGGSIAMLTALEYPERVAGLILLDPAVYTGSGGPSWLRPLLATPQLQRIGPLIARRIRDWGVDFGRAAWHDPEKIDEEAWAGYLKPLGVENWDRALWEFTAASGATGLTDRLGELTMPTLIITGDDDRIVPTNQSVRLASKLPNAELVVIPACGHIPHEECPDETLRAMEDWLQTLGQGQ